LDQQILLGSYFAEVISMIGNQIKSLSLASATQGWANRLLNGINSFVQNSSFKWVHLTLTAAFLTCPDLDLNQNLKNCPSQLLEVF